MSDNPVMGSLVEVDWLDTNSPDRNSWITAEEMDKRSPIMLMQSCGYFMGEKEGYIRIVGNRSISEDYETVVNRVEFIPLCCIKTVKVMEVANVPQQEAQG